MDSRRTAASVPIPGQGIPRLRIGAGGASTEGAGQRRTVTERVAKGDEAAVVESVKAASEVYAPVTGEIVGANQTLADNPGLVNEDAMGAGWFFKLRLGDAGELVGLMDEEAYVSFVEEQA